MTPLSLLIAILVVFLYYAYRASKSAPTSRKQSRQSSGTSGNRVFYAQVHGIYHKNDDGSSRQQIIKDCYEGEELRLVPEPNNPVDPNAVKICRKNGEQLGYWQGDGRMAHDLAIGWTYRITIDEIYKIQDNRKRGARLRVEVLTMSTKTEARLQKKQNLV